jgi:ribosomal protein S18 acetylase RimI-like enzyme
MAEKIKIRQARLEDISRILAIEGGAWGSEKSASREMFESRIKTFPEGVLVAENNGKIVGVVVIERVNYDLKNNAFTWYQITDNGFIKNSHNPNGDTIYGVDLSVAPAFQNSGIGTRLLENIGKMAIRYNVKRGMLGGRIPDYYKHSNEVSIEDYVKSDVDPEVRFYRKAGLKIIKIIPNYFKDPESLNYGILLLWENPFYNKWYRWLVATIFKI